ncbi:MAG: hypothetical protein JRC69_07160 [Deltaproteobacteria bacterium]|nr:hypothetical protein [Deltaproteobacteria bacterium]
MMKSLMLIMLLLAALSGCASRHYVEQKTDSLVFSLQLPEATRVQFSSSTDNFVLHDTVKNGLGIWQLTVPLGSELKYFYIVDGSVYLPGCRFKETDDFGAENCLYQP